MRGRRLAAELRRLRELTGMTGEEVARLLGWSGSKVSRIELRRTGLKQADLTRLLDLYQVDEPHRTDLLALARESSQRGWLEVVTADFAVGYAEYVQAEAEARSVWNWEPQVVPGLLQSPEYARAVMQGWRSMFALPPGDVDRRVQTRLVRQQRLTSDPPLELSVVVDESVLHRKFGDAGVMRRQLNSLVEASRQANLDLRVLPLDGSHPMATGAFTYMQFAQVHDVAAPDLVSVEHLDGSYYLENEDDTHRYRVTFEHLQTHALDREQSRNLISQTASGRWS
ncbi:MAG TPA: helix-turn-helix transcriptional regulator [Streptosporangiaceae bacterium]|nr:helix-turn-helix transcriptional regulator [Streptosporangiaceae bacterium]